ncbi:MAG TPA: LacI family transcriptional regulator [Firmicutes bacterium]|nr:LacI family transcriptional regulator [Bacillota bacterium]
MGVTIKDVAKAAGVSTATVSRVLNNSNLITPQTTEKVRNAMRELGYFPNNIARSFANQNTYIIALVVDIEEPTAFNNPYFYQIQYGIEKYICPKGYYLMIVNENTLNHNGTAFSKLFFEKRVDGLILPVSLLHKNLVKKMEEQKFPFVIIGEPENSYDTNWIDINNKMAGEISTTHLIENQYKRIAFVSGSRKDLFNKNRLDGYLTALAKHGFQPNPDLIKEGGFSKEDGYSIMNEFFKQNNPPDGIVFTDNLVAFGALSAIKEHGIKIPDDIGLVSFDNFPVAELSDPQITTVDIDLLDLGIQAASMLLKEIQLPSTTKQQSLLSVRLIKRGTSKRSQR